MRDRQHLGCLRVRDGVIQLERMHFADEVRPTKGLAPKGVRVAKTELDMAVKLVKQVSGTFDPKRFKDTYRDKLSSRSSAPRRRARPSRSPRKSPRPRSRSI